MSYCKEEGKDKIVFMTSEDLMKPSTINFPEEEDEAPGLVLPNGDINWECPCLGGMATGPCGVEFREAFTCFHYSTSEAKGSECYDAFKTMQECMLQYPTVYGKEDKADETEDPLADDSTDKPEEPSAEVKTPLS